ncbi:MAG: peptidoglycan endopeptidase [Novosphingobium sp.]|nr:peptidoglycan endopeptidase [Novosphingobium sp.]
MTAALESAARELVGVPFRLHGRDPRTGLDCVGVVAEVLRRIGRQPIVPGDYTLRNASVSRFLSYACDNDLVCTKDGGQIVLCMVNPIQPHLLVRVTGGFVHAHASLRRVTFLSDPLPWQISRQWLLDPSMQTENRDWNS